MRHDLYLLREDEEGGDVEVGFVEFRDGSTLTVAHRALLGSAPPWVEEPSLGPLDYGLWLASAPRGWCNERREPVDDQAEFLDRIYGLRHQEALWSLVSRVEIVRIMDGWQRLLSGLDVSWVERADWVLVRMRHLEGAPPDCRVLL